MTGVKYPVSGIRKKDVSLCLVATRENCIVLSREERNMCLFLSRREKMCFRARADRNVCVPRYAFVYIIVSLSTNVCVDVRSWFESPRAPRAPRACDFLFAFVWLRVGKTENRDAEN